jgi:hypothetical protein
VARELLSGGWFIVGEEVLSDFVSEMERRRKVLELHTALLQYAIDCDAPPPVLEAACDVLANDMLGRGEFKISLNALKSLLVRYFEISEEHKIWPIREDCSFGDCLLICKRK